MIGMGYRGVATLIASRPTPRILWVLSMIVIVSSNCFDYYVRRLIPYYTDRLLKTEPQMTLLLPYNIPHIIYICNPKLL